MEGFSRCDRANIVGELAWVVRELANYFTPPQQSDVQVMLQLFLAKGVGLTEIVFAKKAQLW